MDKSKIEWTDATWNPVRGCSIVSKGCKNCYAMKVAHRFSGQGKAYDGLTMMSNAGPVWNGKITLVPELLDQPLRWKRPRRIFVNSMSDLFHEDIPFEFIASVFAVMGVTTRHTYQVLTKRPERMMKFFKWAHADAPLDLSWADERIQSHWPKHVPWNGYDNCGPLYPYQNVWLGVSAEDPDTYKKRVTYLSKVPAAVRFISFEPLLSDIGDLMLDGVFGGVYQWAIIGGESGHGARPMALGWAKDIVRQCKAAGVHAFVKQLGANPTNREGDRCPHIKHNKGADMSEWPAELQVREFPSCHP